MSIRRAALVAALLSGACQAEPEGSPRMQALVDEYATVRLTTDLSKVSETDQHVLRLLIEAVEPMDDAFWQEAYGDRAAALSLAGDDPAMRRFIEMNYGPWDRLRDNEPFVPGIGAKAPGANFYPAQMSDEEFQSDAADDPALRSLYTLVRRNMAGVLSAVPYNVAFQEQHFLAATKLRQAAEVTGDPALARYLQLRAEALLTDEYQASDLAWMDMKDNQLDVIIGPVETYEDALYGYKAAHEGYVLVKDMEWSRRLARFAEMLPDLQRGLPVSAAYKREVPGTNSELNAYDVVYYAGQGNTGGKTIAINLPNDEEVQLQKGTRRLQLENAMRAKFDRILLPIADALIAPDQREHVTFDAFFANTMFHEVAHGLGVKNTINGRGTVREALREHYNPTEEGKADVVGLQMVKQLLERGELTETTLEDHFVTFLAGIFRSVRFGAADAHGRANMVRFNFFEEAGAFERDPATGTYRVDFDAMSQAIDDLSELILVLQGDGNYQGIDELMRDMGDVPPGLQADLERIDAMGIPRDVVFEQGASVIFGG